VGEMSKNGTNKKALGRRRILTAQVLEKLYEIVSLTDVLFTA
jgi:hypothetical protein